MSRLVFLGTGGGRFVTTKQMRATGGLALELDGVRFHIDPGPGALVRAKEFGVNLGGVDALLVSHVHFDHAADVNAVVEAMTTGATKHRGTLLGSDSVVHGLEGDYPAVSKYHAKALEKVVAMKPGDKTNVGSVEIEATPTKHTDPTCIGFVFRGSKQISYVSDSEYFAGLAKHHAGSEVLILNVLRPHTVAWPKHINTNDAIEVMKSVRPTLTVFNHFGIKMVLAGPEKEARLAAAGTGLKVVAGRDGMKLDLDDEKGLKKFSS